jgi:hypothetical protein
LSDCSQKQQQQTLAGSAPMPSLRGLFIACSHSLSAILAFLKKQAFLLSYRAHPTNSAFFISLYPQKDSFLQHRSSRERSGDAGRGEIDRKTTDDARRQVSLEKMGVGVKEVARQG